MSTLSDNDIFFTVKLYFGSGILGIDNLIPCRNFHFHFFAVYKTAGAYFDDFRLLRFSLACPGRTIPDFVVSSASSCFNTTRSPNGTNFIMVSSL